MKQRKLWGHKRTYPVFTENVPGISGMLHTYNIKTLREAEALAAKTKKRFPTSVTWLNVNQITWGANGHNSVCTYYGGNEPSPPVYTTRVVKQRRGRKCQSRKQNA